MARRPGGVGLGYLPKGGARAQIEANRRAGVRSASDPDAPPTDPAYGPGVRVSARPVPSWVGGAALVGVSAASLGLLSNLLLWITR